MRENRHLSGRRLVIPEALRARLIASSIESMLIDAEDVAAREGTIIEWDTLKIDLRSSDFDNGDNYFHRRKDLVLSVRGFREETTEDMIKSVALAKHEFDKRNHQGLS